jgi:SAM-dependent methyltransferase
MKNILNEKPKTDLKGRLKYSVEFVSNEDIQNKNILDIGCGYGWCELNFLNRGVNKICGIEISENDLKTIKENIQSKKAEFKIGSAIQIPYPDNYFDTAVSWEVIEHIPKNNELKMFSEVSRVLKKNGMFYLSTPYENYLSNILDPAWWLIGHRHYTSKKLREYGEKNGFEVIEIKTCGGIFSLFSIINLYISKWIFRREPFFKDFFIRKDHEEYFDNKPGIFNIFIKYRKK